LATGLVRLRDFLAPILLAFAEMTYREVAVRVVCGCICALLHPTIATARPACSPQLIGVDFDGGDILPVRPAAATSAAECCSICQSNVNCALRTVCFACNLLCAAHSRDRLATMLFFRQHAVPLGPWPLHTPSTLAKCSACAIH
jgi:hypothetical protein